MNHHIWLAFLKKKLWLIKESTEHLISAFWVKIDRDWIGQGSCKLAFPIVSEPPHSHELPLGIRKEFKNIFFRAQIICFHPKTIGTNGDPSILILIFTFAPNQVKSSTQSEYPQTLKNRNRSFLPQPATASFLFISICNTNWKNII